MRKVCIVVSNVDKVVAFEWIVEGLRNKYEFYFVIVGPKGSFLSKYLRDSNIECYEIGYRGKRDAIKALFKTFFYLRKKKIDVVHTHLVDATLYGLLSAWFLRIKKRIYTRHHSDYNYKYSPKGIKYDKLSNWLATDIIAITEQVKEILIEKEKVPERKISLVHHGIDIGYFENPNEAAVQQLREKYNLAGKNPVIAVVARQTHWKGIQFIIPAFAEILKQFPGSCLVLCNAHGDYESEIDKLLSKYVPEENFRKIKYEYDNSSLYHLFDLLVHTPIDPVVEAFGQVYIEALAAGIPCVFTLSGIAVHVIRNNEHALVVPYCDSPSITEAVSRILRDPALKANLVMNGRKLVHEEFSIGMFLDNLSKVYDR